ncbi:MAG: hypothetical protein WD771_05045 [Gemmatimonadaceae bacterium]
MPPQRRGRGVDFEHRYKASKWAEDILLKAFLHKPFVAVRLGTSGVSADNLVGSVAGEPKVPDLLVFDAAHLSPAEHNALRSRDYDLREVTTAKLSSELSFVLAKARCAVEVEFSPYKASEMKQRAYVRKTKAQLDKRPLKHAKAPTAPNIFIKEEDLGPLSAWQSAAKVPIIVVHVFDQECFGISLEEVLAFRKSIETHDANIVRLSHLAGIFREIQNYDRVDAQGAGEKKAVYKVSPATSILAGKVESVVVEAVLGESASKKYVSQVRFSMGRVVFSDEFISWVLSRGRR